MPLPLAHFFNDWPGRGEGLWVGVVCKCVCMHGVCDVEVMVRS